MLRNRAACALVLAVLAVAGCARTAPKTPRPPVTGLQIDPAEPSVAIGETLKLTAVAVLANGATQELDGADWALLGDEVATLSAVKGVAHVTGVKAGEVRIEVRALSFVAEVPLKVTGPRPVSLAVTPPERTTGLGGVVSFVATATLSDQSTQVVTAEAEWSLDDPKIAQAKEKGSFSGLAAGTTTVKARYQGLEATSRLVVSSATLVRVDVTPPVLVLPLKSSVGLKAVAVFDDASVSDVTAQASWTSSAATVVKVEGGLVTGLSAGNATITATFEGKSGNSAVQVTAAQLKSVELSPPSLQLAKGTSGAFKATALFDSPDVPPQDVTLLASWESTAPAVASASTTEPGSFLGIAPGEAQAKASYLGVVGAAKVSVTAATLLALAVNPARQTLPKGASAQYQAMGTYTDGTNQDVTELVLWNSRDPSIASLSNAEGSKGLAQAKAPGTVTVEATLDGRTGQATLEVTAAQLEALEVLPQDTLLAKGTSAPLRAQATFTDQSQLDVTEQADWTSSDNSIASVSTLGTGRGLVSGIKPGTVTVTAAFGGKSAKASVVVSPATLTALAIAPLDPTLAKGTTQQMKATGTYSDGSIQDVTRQVVWSMATPSIASVSNASGEQGLVTGLSPGETTLTATLLSRTAKTTVTVTPATLTRLTIRPSPTTLEYKGTQQLVATATYSDGSSVDVTATTAWTSDDPSVASVVSGLVTGNRAGKTSVTGTFGGKSVKVEVTVNAPKLTRLEIRPASLSLPAGRKGQLACWGIYADGSQVEVTLKAAWSASPGNVRVDSRGEVTALSPGVSTVTALFETFTATAKVDVGAPEVDTLTITPTTAKVPQGQKQTFTVRAFLSDGSSQDVTLQTLFTSNDTQGFINLVGNTATGLKQGGPVVITASYGGKTVTAQLTIGPPVVVDSLRIDPTFVTLAVGGKKSFTVTAVYTDGTNQDVTASCLFVSADPSVVGLQANEAVGVKEGGPVNVTASYGGKTAIAQVKVSPAALVSIEIQPAGVVLQKGESAQLKAMAKYSDGSQKDVTSLCTWETSNFMICSAIAGTVKGVGAGTATVTAKLSGVEGTATVVVEAPVMNRIAIVPPNAFLRPNLVYPFRAYGLYSDGTVTEIPNELDNWETTNLTVASPFKLDGYFGILAGATGNAGLTVNFDSGSGQTSVYVHNSPITGVEVSPAKLVLPRGTAAKLAGVFAYKAPGDGWAVEIQNPQWSSLNSTVATIDPNGVVSAQTPGQTNVQVKTYSAEPDPNDPTGWKVYTATTAVTVTSGTLTSIELSVPPKLVVGLTTRLRAKGTFSDGTVLDLGPSAVIYSTSDASLAAMSRDVDGAKVTAKAAGSITLSATMHGVTRTVPVTLVSTTLSTLGMSVAQTTLAQGSTSPLTVTGTFADGTTLDLTESATYASSAPDVAQVAYGLFTNMSWPLVLAHAPNNPPQNATLTASFQGKSATAAMKVNGVNLRSLALAVGSAAPSPTLTLSGPGPFHLRVVGTFTDNSTADVTPFCTFTPASPGTGVVATISNALAGKVTVLGKGSQTVTATYAPSYINQPLISGSATLVVP